MTSLKILAVIQARGGSKGIPKKNIYPVNGHPLMAYTIAAAQNSELITDLVVSTDSGEIADVGRTYGAQVPFMRPDHLSGDKVLSVDSLNWAVLETETIKNLRYDYVVELPCVSPLRSGEDIDGALKLLIDTGADSVISMADTGEKHPIRLKKIVDGQIEDFTKEYPEPEAGSRRQDLKPPSYIRNGAIYSMTRACIVEKYSRHGEDTRPYIMDSGRSINIDEPIDLIIAEALIDKGYCPNHPVKVAPVNVDRCENGRKNKLLVTTNLSFMPQMRREIEEVFDAIFAYGADQETVAELLPEVDGWMCSPCPPYLLDAELLSKAPNLKALGTPSTGSNHVDADWCQKNGVTFFCLKGTDFVNSITASSEFTFALILEVTRRGEKAIRYARQGRWRETEDDLRGIELAGKTLGLIGYGRIGANNARYAKPFGMKVIACDPYKTISDDWVTQLNTAEDVLKTADIIAICVHLDESTEGMVTREWFAAMKPGAYFVNTSRGEIVDEGALLEALKSGHIKAAALDVISGEMATKKKEHPLIRYSFENDNLVITPHIAGLTVDSELKAAQRTFAFLKEQLD